MYSVKAPVVPELSERWTVAIDTLGRFTPEFSAAIAGSFHLVILLAKICAMTSAFSLRVRDPGEVVLEGDPAGRPRGLYGRALGL